MSVVRLVLLGAWLGVGVVHGWAALSFLEAGQNKRSAENEEQLQQVG